MKAEEKLRGRLKEGREEGNVGHRENMANEHHQPARKCPYQSRTIMTTS